MQVAILFCQILIFHLVVGIIGTPLYGLYRYVQPQRVGFFSRFGHKWGIDFRILVLNLEEATSLSCPPRSIRALPSFPPV